ncbi:hypothetical protein ACG2F4_02830 [Halalkalibaculum sp. DA3122]|uniref:hypothetical protein n=1 Tax=Halalkalibaculum sp. DA3122 TaxID=3373607 RepID=UPI003754B6FE
MTGWNRIRKSVRIAGDTVEKRSNKLAHIVASLVESAGVGVADALHSTGAKRAIEPLFTWMGGSLKGIFSLLSTVINAVLGIAGGLVGGFIKIAGGLLTAQGRVMAEGAGDIVSVIFGSIILVAGKLVALIQAAIAIQDFERPLTTSEERMLKRVFRDSLNCHVVRVVEGRSGLFGLSERAFTLGNTLYMKTEIFPDYLLIHEATHAWQYQHMGARYASDALMAQWFLPDAYNWQKEISDRKRAEWTLFNREAQAEFLADIWKYGELKNSNGQRAEEGGGAFFDADGQGMLAHFKIHNKDYTDMANDAVNKIRYT